MHEYLFESITVTRRREGGDLQTDYRELIRKHARNGWEFVQAINLENHALPRLELIFKRTLNLKEH